MPTDQQEALVRVVAILDAIGIPYLLTGSVAAGIYIVPRMTRDVDILIDPKPEDRDRLVNALSDDDFAVFPEAVDEALRRRSMFNVIDQRNLTKVDIIVRDRARDPDALFDRSILAPIMGADVRTISLEDLVVSKLRWAQTSRSAMQFRDVRNLLARPQIDHAYLSRRINELGLGETMKEASDERHDA